MTLPDRRLVCMWEAEPVGVDPRRPLVGFALVAVLCAVLMMVTVGRGWGTDVFGPARPLAAPAADVRPSSAPTPPAAPTTVDIQAELSAPLLGAVPAGTVPAGSRPTGTDKTARRAGRDADRDASKNNRKAHGAAAKAARRR